MVAEWHGLDISSSMIEHARARTRHLPNVYLHHLPTMDPAGLAMQPFATRPFDLVYCTVVFMHLDKEDLFAYLRALRGLLKPGAPAYFDTWNILHPDTFRIWSEGAVTGDQKPRGRVQGSTADEFALYLHKAGFDIERLDCNDRLLRAVVRNPANQVADRPPHPARNLLDLTPPRSDAGDTFAPFGYVGNPRTGDRLKSGILAMDGWAMDRVEQVTVQVHLTDSPDGAEPLRQVEAQIGQPRPEVPGVFPDFADGPRSGWVAQLPLENLPSGLLRIRVLARDSEGLVSDLAGVDLTIIHEP
jgi:SAM-dependent methyltransferase